MKTYLDCLPCYMNQAIRAGRMATNDDKKIKQLLDQVGDMIKHIPMENTPAESGAMIYQKIKEITGVEDPYKTIKQNSINEAKALYPELKEIINKSKDKLLTAIRIAIAGNIIDFGINKKFNLVDDVKKILIQDFAIFDYEKFKSELEKSENILYLADNAGESVFDKLLIEELNKKVIYAVREIPVINDVTIQDAIDSGIADVAEIISSGVKAPGTILNQCNNNFLDLFDTADMIISKGQGNYEGLSDINRSVFFLLKAKCSVIAKDIGVKEDDIVIKSINL
ncbi:MAG: DUF89 family protein [Bacteroidales bacterium]|nr:DUF89 family protein [Bacteroidales bacterium]MBN2758421.1 DUF89 family protein [Bacteroidales bacterium]